MYKATKKIREEESNLRLSEGELALYGFLRVPLERATEETRAGGEGLRGPPTLSCFFRIRTLQHFSFAPTIF